MSTQHSYKGRLEIQTDGVSGIAGYNELTLIGSAVLTSSRTASVAPRRGSEFKTSVSGQTEIEVTAAITWDDADTVVAAIESAHFANTHLGAKFLDKASGTGLTADMLVTGWTLDQSEDSAQIVNITLIPTFVDTAPAWA